MKKYIVIICLFFSLSANSQNAIDTLSLHFNIKIRLLNYAFGDILDSNSVQCYLKNYQPPLKQLKSENINGFLFFEVDAKKFIDTLSDQISADKKTIRRYAYFAHRENKFIIGYHINSQSIYLLNDAAALYDIIDFFDTLKQMSYFQDNNLKKVSVEGLNLKCMYKFYRKYLKKKHCHKIIERGGIHVVRY